MKARVIVTTAIIAAVAIIIGGYVWQSASQSDHIEISLWEEEQPAIQEILDAAIERFEARQQKIRVRRSHFKTEDLRNQFQMGAIGGRGPELILAPNDFAGVFKAAGIIQPVQQWADMPRFATESINAITDENGQSYGVPVNLGNHLILFVNKKLMSTAPETIEEILTPSAFNDPQNNRFDLAFNVLEPFWFVPFLGAFGQRPLVREQPNLDTSATIAALDVLKAMKFDSKVIPGDCDYACAETLFLEGKTAMTINGDWAIGRFYDALTDDLIIAPLPRSELTGLYMEPMVSGKYLMLRTNLSEELFSAVREFTEFMVSEDIQMFLASRSKRLPALRSVLESNFVREDPLLLASVDAMKHAQPMPMEVELRAVWDAIRPQLQEVMAGRQTAAEAAVLMQKDAETKIEAISH